MWTETLSLDKITIIWLGILNHVHVYIVSLFTTTQKERVLNNVGL